MAVVVSAIGTVTPSPHALALAGVDLPETHPPVLRVAEAREVVVVLPRSRLPHREIHLQHCEHDRVPVVTRPSGGGAVVLSPGVVTVSVLARTDHPGLLPEPHFVRMGGVVVAALQACGVTGVTQRGVSDLCLGGRKVAGSALRLWGQQVLYQLSLLVDPDLALMDRYLPMPSRQPVYRLGRPHLEFVTTLRHAGFTGSVTRVAGALCDAFAAHLLTS